MQMILLLLFTTVPVEYIKDERVDAIELIHYYNDSGTYLIDYVIFYNWTAKTSRYNIQDWRISNHSATRNPSTGDWEYVFNDGFYLTRRVKTKLFREVWTQRDIERDDQEFIPKMQRRGLIKWER